MDGIVKIVALLAVGYFIGVYFPAWGQSAVSKASSLVS